METETDDSMPNQRDDEVLRILKIARDHSTLRGGRGLSLRDLLEECNFRQLRPRLASSHIEAVLEKHPGEITMWLAYSEDKRTSVGWYFANVGESRWQIGKLDGTHELFESPIAACSEFVLRELDTWSTIDAAR